MSPPSRTMCGPTRPWTSGGRCTCTAQINTCVGPRLSKKVDSEDVSGTWADGRLWGRACGGVSHALRLGAPGIAPHSFDLQEELGRWARVTFKFFIEEPLTHAGKA